MNDCEGKQIAIKSRERFINNMPGEHKIIGDVVPPKCDWPKCNCRLSGISGAFHQEKIDWIVKETIKDPKFKHKIRI